MSELHVVNHNFLATHAPERIVADIIKVQDDHDVSEQGITVEMDEMWSYVGSKANQRWLWHAIDRATGEVLAYVLGKRRDEVFLELKLKGLLEPFGIIRFYTDDWGAYEAPFRVRETYRLENKTRRK